MKLRDFCLILTLTGSLASCFWRTEKSPAPVDETSNSATKILPAASGTPEAAKKERSLEIFVKYFEQADAIHREAWWVLTSERRPAGKSPFGKVQRAILSSQNIPLANKSLFRCDRYIFKRDVLSPGGFPQKAEIFEKCSEKTGAKKIAEFYSTSKNEIQATFFPENLEEILGLGATVLNRSIVCKIKGNENEQLDSLKCTDWAQDRNKDQMIRLDEYEYARAGKNLIKLRGKVYENLSDTRKIEADVPMEGKILVKETELYPPEPTPTPTPSVATGAKPSGKETPQRPANAPPLVLPADGSAPPGVSAIPMPGQMPAPRQSGPVVDPDVMMMQQQQQQLQNPEAAHFENGEMVPSALDGETRQQMEYQEQQNQEQRYPVPPPSAPAGGVYGR